MKSQMQNQEPHAEHHFADFFESLLIWGSIGWPLKCKLMGFFKHTLLSRAPPPCVVLCQGPEVNFPGHPRVTKLFCIGSPLNRSRSLTYCNGITVDKNHFHSLHSTAAFSTDALHNANIDRFDGVWKVTGDCLGNSEECQGGSHSKSIDENPMKEHWVLF